MAHGKSWWGTRSSRPPSSVPRKSGPDSVEWAGVDCTLIQKVCSNAPLLLYTSPTRLPSSLNFQLRFIVPPRRYNETNKRSICLERSARLVSSELFGPRREIPLARSVQLCASLPDVYLPFLSYSLDKSACEGKKGNFIGREKKWCLRGRQA